MVPLNEAERRHRIQGEEVPQVMAALRARLLHHLKAKEDLFSATMASIDRPTAQAKREVDLGPPGLHGFNESEKGG